MSLDVTLYLKKHVSYDNCLTWTEEKEEVYAANITHNLNTMATEAGIYQYLWRPDELLITQAKDLIKPLADGLYILKSDPEYYKKFNPPNKWGSYEVLIEYIEKYLSACEKYPNALVEVCR